MDTYPVIDIPADAKEDTEQLGSKPKFWITHCGERWLYKAARPGTGEDWSEKVAAEIAAYLRIPAAKVDLASYNGQRGCILLNFVDVKAGEALIHGNEILPLVVTDYDKSKRFSQSDHTIHNIVASVIRASKLLEVDAESIVRDMASYMVLDALIGNTDRHHENWGLLAKPDMDGVHVVLKAAPSFDHASSLGRELRGERTAELLAENRVASYVRRGRGGIYRDDSDSKGENPLRLATFASKVYPSYFSDIMTRVDRLTDQAIHEVMERIPDTRIEESSREFAAAMIRFSRDQLIEASS